MHCGPYKAPNDWREIGRPQVAMHRIVLLNDQTKQYHIAVHLIVLFSTW